jgi:hypothetical protein
VASNKVTIKLKPDDVAKSGKLSVAVVADSGASPAVTLHVTDLAIAVAALPPAKVKNPYTQTLACTGGIGPYHWSAQNLPGGLKVSDNGTLTGMPEKEGSLSVTLTLSDSTDATVSKQIMLQIDP